MRILISICLSTVTMLCLSAHDFALYRAREHGALAKECLRVVDQEGIPIAGARVWGGCRREAIVMTL